MCSGWCTEGGSSGSMQCVWKEGECELNPEHNMWLLGTRAMFRSARKFGKSVTGLCAVCRAGGRKAADEFHFEDVKLECVCEFAYLGDILNGTGGVEQTVAALRSHCPVLNYLFKYYQGRLTECVKLLLKRFLGLSF